MSEKFKPERLFQILLAPVISEKATAAADKLGHFTFKVLRDASKAEIAAAVELLFEVKVQSVRTVKVKGKTKRFGRILGRRSDWKKAYVALMPGQDIELGTAE